MQLEEFRKTINAKDPPSNLNNYALALWYDAKGNWEKAHTLIQDLPDKTAARIHGYLHRKEGDTGNAGYWYSRAGTSMPAESVEQEWNTIAKAVLRADV